MEVKLWFLKIKKSHKLGRQCHGSGSKLMASYHEPMFDPRPVHLELEVEKLVLRHSSLWLLWFSPVSFIPKNALYSYFYYLPPMPNNLEK
jgi:hypothetical protein